MSKPHVTVGLGSSRPGGIDISFKGLADQTYKDFEVIFVDGRYHKRHRQVLEYAKKIGLEQPLYHVPNHRYNGIWGANVAGVNTGFMLADGDIFIMLMDYAYCPPGWIEAHLKMQDVPRLVMSPHVYCQLPAFRFKGKEPPMTFSGGPETTVENVLNQRENFCDEISIFAEPFVANPLDFQIFEDNDPKMKLPVGNPGIGYNYMHTKNDSFPLKSVLDIGGMDENWDRGRGPGDTEFGFRLVYGAGLEPWISQDARVYCLNPRPIMPNLNLTIPIKWTVDHPNTVGRWSYEEGSGYFAGLQASMAATGNFKARNPYEMREKRKELWKWRELSQDPEPIIPKNEICDKEYFGW